MQKQVVGIFAKQPLAGRVKTRLCPPLSAAQAASLYETCLRETVEVMAEGDFDRVLFYAGEADWFRKAFPGLPLLPQRGADLGERMDNALRQLLTDYDRAALIGSDSPDLPPELVAQAFSALDDGVVVIPSRDGGYALVGARQPHPAIFHDIPWSTAAVLPATRRRAAELSIRLREVGQWEDLDDLPSLQRFLTRSPQAATARHARQILASQTT